MIRFDLYRSRRALGRQRWRWRVTAANGRVLAGSGEAYANFADALDAIGVVRGPAVLSLPPDATDKQLAAADALVRTWGPT